MSKSVFIDFKTEAECYWLGFLFADGYASKTSNAICIELSARDKLHLKKFADWCDSTLYERDRLDKRTGQVYSMCSVHYTNKLQRKILSGLGLVPNKSSVDYMIPTIIPTPMVYHFIRGYFDGDGSIRHKKIRWDYKSKSGICLQLSFSIVNSSPAILVNIAKYLREICSAKLAVKAKQKENCYYIGTCGNIVCKDIYHYLYDDATIYLERKKSKFESI